MINGKIWIQKNCQPAVPGWKRLLLYYLGNLVPKGSLLQPGGQHSKSRITNDIWPMTLKAKMASLLSGAVTQVRMNQASTGEEWKNGVRHWGAAVGGNSKIKAQTGWEKKKKKVLVRIPGYIQVRPTGKKMIQKG